MTTIFDFLLNNPWITLIGAATLIQISPLKIDPWSWIGKQIKKLLVGDMEKNLQDIQKTVMLNDMNSKRWFILDFANSCRQGRRHTKEEWEHCVGDLQIYEEYCKKNSVPNGVMIECAKYLRASYQNLMTTNDFLN